MTQQYTNIAFISYKREDEKWAKWLQKKLEHYKLPTEIRKQNPNMEFAKSPRHVFKDTTDLSGGVLAKAIKEGLDSSKFLIVICSPRAAKSPWVCKEVQDFIDSGREEYIIPFIIDGQPYAQNPEDECFPESLKSLAGERELLGININENGRESAVVKVVAQMFEVRFDVLWDRFQRQERKHRFILGLLSFFVVAFLAVISAILYTNNTELYKRQCRFITEKAAQLLETNDIVLAQMLLLEALPGNPHQAETLLRKSLEKNTNKLCESSFSEILCISPNGKFIVGKNTDSVLQIWLTENGELISEFSVHEDSDVSFIDDDVFCVVGGGRLLLFDLSLRTVSNTIENDSFVSCKICGCGDDRILCYFKDQDDIYLLNINLQESTVCSQRLKELSSKYWTSESYSDGSILMNTYDYIVMYDTRLNQVRDVVELGEYSYIGIAKEHFIMLYNSHQHQLKLIPLEDLSKSYTFVDYTIEPSLEQIDAEGYIIALTSHSGEIMLYDIATSTVILTATQLRGESISSLAFVKDDSSLFWVSSDSWGEYSIESGSFYQAEIPFAFSSLDQIRVFANSRILGRAFTPRYTVYFMVNLYTREFENDVFEAYRGQNDAYLLKWDLGSHSIIVKDYFERKSSLKKVIVGTTSFTEYDLSFITSPSLKKNIICAQNQYHEINQDMLTPLQEVFGKPVGFIPTINRLMTYSENKFYLWDIKKNSLITCFEADSIDEQKYDFKLSYSSKLDSWLASCKYYREGEDFRLTYIFDKSYSSVSEVIREYSDSIKEEEIIAYSFDGRLKAVSNSSNTIGVYDVLDNTLLQSITIFPHSTLRTFTDIHFSHDGSMICALHSEDERSFYVIDVSSGEIIYCYNTDYILENAVFSFDDKTIISMEYLDDFRHCQVTKYELPSSEEVINEVKERISGRKLNIVERKEYLLE